ncbi:MAG TPA: PBP1A family penicillin-binding protein [Candidatus Fimiplasma intestinipullorum]|uniref:Penicillin-binding protein 1A n=1 Tax=Candidatus Fimiplasma intestinipullorum TaxID=2840825 RepID=A0A9D1HPD1_9FIRM|nr:PBP1A family penicillin-binding protein [Candidatus Fimiplasma intestinipullorum]
MRKVIKIMGIILGSLTSLVVLLYGIAFLAGKPEIGIAQSLEMVDRDGETFYVSINDSTSEWVTLEEVSPYFIDALLDTEDQYFYWHPGFDLIGIARAAMIDLKNMNLNQGASTITQQYVKNLFLTNEKSWTRKFKEAFLTMQVETHYSKDEILEGYLNTVYFGHGCYGLEAASQYYFSQSSQSLNLSQASLLAGMVNGPELYSPIKNPELAKERQSVVLNAMKNNGHINELEYEATLASPIELQVQDQEDENVTEGYYVDYVKSELARLGFDDEQYRSQGLKVYTTMDTELQLTLSRSITKYLGEDELQNAVVCLKPYTSEILALSGGNNYQDSQYNRALYAKRQMASTVKPLLYYDALANGMDPLTTFMSEKTTFQLANHETYSPQNFNDAYPNQEITMINALATSDNIYAVKTHLFLGTNQLAQSLKDFGFSEVKDNASLALGTVDTSILQLAGMYNTFASEGMYQEPYAITRIENRNGEVLYTHQEKTEEKLDQDLCLVMNQMMTATFDASLVGYATPTMLSFKTDQTFAAKTGSSDWDSWVVGFNPEILVGIWTGYDDMSPFPEEHKTVAREIFRDLTSFYMEGQEDVWYQPTANLVQVPIDPANGTLDPNGSIYWFYNRPGDLQIPDPT